MNMCTKIPPSVGMARSKSRILGRLWACIMILLATGQWFSEEAQGGGEMVPRYAGAAHGGITPSTAVKSWVTGDAYRAEHDPIFARAPVLGDGVGKVVILHWELVD